MSLGDVAATKPGEMIDWLNCLAIYKGVAKEKKTWTFDQVMALE
jgi:hypothetical protein